MTTLHDYPALFEAMQIRAARKRARPSAQLPRRLPLTECRRGFSDKPAIPDMERLK